ncbi:hypothetical protein D3C81_1265270 [compost metagenome]
MIYHDVYKLIEAGITDILIITGRDHMGAVPRHWEEGLKDFLKSYQEKDRRVGQIL